MDPVCARTSSSVMIDSTSMKNQRGLARSGKTLFFGRRECPCRLAGYITDEIWKTGIFSRSSDGVGRINIYADVFIVMNKYSKSVCLYRYSDVMNDAAVIETSLTRQNRRRPSHLMGFENNQTLL